MALLVFLAGYGRLCPIWLFPDISESQKFLKCSVPFGFSVRVHGHGSGVAASERFEKTLLFEFRIFPYTMILSTSAAKVKVSLCRALVSVFLASRLMLSLLLAF